MPLLTPDTDLLLQFVSNRDVPCPVCGYNLRASAAPRCPECGRSLRLSVAVDERAHLPWTLAVIACASTVFFSLFLAVQLSGVESFRPWEWAISLTCFALSIATVPLLLLRRAVVAWRPRAKWALAVAAWGLWLLMVGGMVVAVMAGA